MGCITKHNRMEQQVCYHETMTEVVPPGVEEQTETTALVHVPRELELQRESFVSFLQAEFKPTPEQEAAHEAAKAFITKEFGHVTMPELFYAPKERRDDIIKAMITYRILPPGYESVMGIDNIIGQYFN